MKGWKIMNEFVVKYVASKVIDDIRSNRIIDDDLAENIDCHPYVDCMRVIIEREDIPKLLVLIDSSSLHVGNLAINLLKKFDHDESVKSFLLSAWEKEKRCERKYKLIWRILDNEDLDSAYHNEIYNFVRQNLHWFLEDQVRWYGGKEQVLDGIKARLKDKTFPKTKNWVYLCGALASSDKESVAQLLREYQESNDEFTARVAKEMYKEHIKAKI